MKRNILATGLLAVLGLVGCSSTMEDNRRLDDFNVKIRKLRDDRLMYEAANRIYTSDGIVTYQEAGELLQMTKNLLSVEEPLYQELLDYSKESNKPATDETVNSTINTIENNLKLHRTQRDIFQRVVNAKGSLTRE